MRIEKNHHSGEKLWITAALSGVIGLVAWVRDGASRTMRRGFGLDRRRWRGG